MTLDTRHKHNGGKVDIIDDRKKASMSYAKGTNLTAAAVRYVSV